MGLDDAIRLINEARHEKIHELNLSNLGLTALPVEIGQLTNLQQLSLRANHLTALPPELGLLNNLKRLHLSKNSIKRVALGNRPASIILNSLTAVKIS